MSKPNEIKQGDLIAARYEVRGSVGRGGMGRIYRVFDKVLGEEVALKTLLPDHVEDKIVLERFFNEARIARSLSHPNIVRVHDIGQSDNTVYISMELLKGKSLRQMLDQLQPGQRLPIAGILRMFDALCAALDYAHHFTVHRDIKPENVMILSDGSVKLMDFGISKLMSNPNLTSASIVMGTPHYMAPEQLRNTSTVDARADIYSVGVMLYEVLTGDRPTGLAKPASKIRGEVPAALDPIIEKCCQLDPNKRYRTAGELRAALRAVRVEIERKTGAGEGELTAAGGVVKRSARGTGRIAVAILALIAVAAMTFGGLRWAEQYRKEILDAAPSGLAELPAPATPETDSPARDFAQLQQAMLDLRASADTSAAQYPQVQQKGILDEILSRGTALWTAAEQLAQTNPAEALEMGWDAAACYLAIVRWPEDMIFVPPSPPGGPRARGFFIDAHPVTLGDFDQFARRESWEWPEGAFQSPSEGPMTGAAHFDAVAYLATTDPARRLPSLGDLERAFARAANISKVLPYGEPVPEIAENDSAADSEASILATRHAAEWLTVPWERGAEGAWYEWTTSIDQNDPDAVPTFGDDVLTFGGYWTRSGSFVTNPPAPQRYEWSHPSLGFRGIVDLPRAFAELDVIR